MTGPMASRGRRRGFVVLAAATMVLTVPACTTGTDPGAIGSSSVIRGNSAADRSVASSTVRSAAGPSVRSGSPEIDGIDLGTLPTFDRPNRERLDHPLIGKSFRSVSMTGGELQVGPRVTMTVGVQQLDLTAGCNNLHGPAEITDATISFGSFRSTAVGCDSETQALEQWFPTFLGDARYLLDGRSLTITAGAVSVTFEQTDSSDEPPAEAPGWWVIDDLAVGDVRYAVRGPVDRTPDGSLVFYVAKGSVAIYGDFCGRATARSTPVATTFPTQRRVATFGPEQGAAPSECTDDVSRAMDAVESVLTGPVTFHRDGWWLEIDAGNGVGVSMHREF